jgi:hypothetical protein
MNTFWPSPPSVVTFAPPATKSEWRSLANGCAGKFIKCQLDIAEVLLSIICFLYFKKTTISFSYIHPGYLISTSNPQVKMLSLSDEL